MQAILEAKIEELKVVCRELSIDRLHAFGSVVSGEFNKHSDIDFLISFSEQISITDYTDNYFKLQYRLREMFNREIDIVTERSLSNPFFIESINESKELIYEA